MARVLTADQYIDYVMQDAGDLPEKAATLKPARLHISHDNWIAECPGDRPHTKIVQHDENCDVDCDKKHRPPLTVTTYGNCGYAIVACPGLPMVCPEHGWFEVEWPKTAAKIEKILDNRPDARNRNWFPGETLKHLRQENSDHGLRKGGR